MAACGKDRGRRAHQPVFCGASGNGAGRYGDGKRPVRSPLRLPPASGTGPGAALHAALEGLDARLPAALPLEQAEQEIEMLPADPDVRNYSFTEVDGRLYFRENSVMRAVELDGANTRRVRS